MAGPSAPLRLAAAIIDFDRRLVRKGDDETPLTTTEDKLLRYLISRAGTVIPRDDLLREVWGYKAGLETRAVDSAVRRLRVKIEHDPKHPVHLKKVYGQGYLFEGGDFAERHAAQPLQAVDPARSNLVNAPSEMVGMQEDIDALVASFETGRNLSCILGPPGGGKTRLAHAVALRLAQQGCEVWWCDATTAKTESELQRMVAEVLGADMQSAGENVDPNQVIAHALAARQSVLLVIDNCEQLDTAARSALASWYNTAPNTAVLLTSREPMEVAGETVVPVATLSTEEAVKLFVLRARAARPGFGIDHAAHEQVASLVQQVDRLPLAIELCAALMDMIGPEALVERLKTTGHLPNVGGQGRHASIATALASSWASLSPGEQEAMARCAVFAGGFDLAAAEAVLQHNGDELMHLRTLVKRSLLKNEPSAQTIRYRMLTSIRRFGLAHLGKTATETRQRHAQWLADTLDPPNTQYAIDVTPALRTLARRWLTDVEQARQWSTDRYPLVAVRLALVADRVLNQTEKATARVNRLLTAASDAQRAGDQATQIETQVRLASAYGTSGNDPAAFDAAEQAHRLAQDFGDPLHLGHAHYAQGRVAIWQDRLDDAQTHLNLAAEALAEDNIGLAHVARWLGYTHSYQGDLQAAETHNLKALSLFRLIDDPTGVAAVLAALATLDLVWGRAEEAEGRYHEAMEIMEEAGELGQIATLHGHLGNCHYDAMRLDEASAAYDRAIEGHQAVGRARFVSVVETNATSLDICRGDFHRARQRVGRVLARIREHPSARTEGYAYSNLTLLTFIDGRDTEALEASDQALACFGEVDDKIGMSSVEVLRCAIFAATGQMEAALAAQATVKAQCDLNPTPTLKTGLQCVQCMSALHQDPSPEMIERTRGTVDQLNQTGTGRYYSQLLLHAIERLA